MHAKANAKRKTLRFAVCVLRFMFSRFWNKNEMEPLRDFARSIEGIYFIHNFKGSNPAVLFRCYPDDWRVFRRRPNDVLECVWSSSTRPKSLKEIALDVLPGCT